MVAILFGFVAFVIITMMESNGYVQYKKTEIKGISSIFSVFKLEKIGFYIVVACLVEISAASIGQWLPLLLKELLGFSENSVNLIYSGISTVRSFMPFVSLIIFRVMKERDVSMMKVTFSISSIGFALLAVSTNKWLGLIFLLMSLMSMSCASALLWSIYIPSLGKTGKVSTINGVLDCTGYGVAALANLLFGSVISNIGWTAVYILWMLIGVVGLMSIAIFKPRNKQIAEG